MDTKNVTYSDADTNGKICFGIQSMSYLIHSEQGIRGQELNRVLSLRFEMRQNELQCLVAGRLRWFTEQHHALK